jgi:hypothetical protein
MKITRECYKKSIDLLLENSGKNGFLASSQQKKAEKRNYLNVFARDASICSLGAIASGNKKLTLSAKNSLQTLAKFQAQNGQIPNYVKPESNSADFWRMGCIDATLWWLLALDFYDKNSDDKNLKKSLKRNCDAALQWLSAQEHPLSKLLIQNEASDWADIFPRSGKVLYTNSLWIKIKTLYKINGLTESQKNFNTTFYPFSANPKFFLACDKTTINEIIKNGRKNDCLLSYVNYLFWGRDIDVYGNSLAILFDCIDDNFKKNIVDFLDSRKRFKKMSIPVLFNPIKVNSREWRKYMESHKQNYPHQYHNGGIWPYASAFWAMALFSIGRREEAETELEKIAFTNQINNWGFHEWFNAKTGKAEGMRGQSWNAGAFVLAWHYLKKDFEFN